MRLAESQIAEAKRRGMTAFDADRLLVKRKKGTTRQHCRRCKTYYTSLIDRGQLYKREHAVAANRLTTLCGLPLGVMWWILSDHEAGHVTCKACLKAGGK